MDIAGWIVDKSAAARSHDPAVRQVLSELAGRLFLCPIGELEQLYSARSARDYDALKDGMHAAFEVVSAPPDIFDRALQLQQDLAHHHGMWHRTPIPDLLIAETAFYHGMGVVHSDSDFERIAEIRPIRLRRVGT